MASAPPLPANSFRVTVAEETIAFSEVSGLIIEREQTTYKHGLSALMGEILITYPSRKHQRITLKRGVFPRDSLFFTWLVTDDAEAKPMTVAILDGTGAPAFVYKIERAVPVKLTGPTLSADSTSVAVEQLELMASGLSIEPGA